MKALPGVLVAGAAALAALGLHTLLPVVPLLTASVLLGMVAGQLPPFQRLAAGVLKPGLGMSAKRFMRIGVVLLGLKLSLVDIAGLGWVTLATTVAIVVVTFFVTLWLGRRLGLAGPEPLLIATGFSICGASAVAAMDEVAGGDEDDTGVAVSPVTCAEAWPSCCCPPCVPPSVWAPSRSAAGSVPASTTSARPSPPRAGSREP